MNKQVKSIFKFPVLASDRGKTAESLFAIFGSQNVVPGLAKPAEAPKTPFQGQQNAIWSSKAPFQSWQNALSASKMPFRSLQNSVCSSKASLQCSKTIQNVCKCTFAAVLTKPSSMDIDGSALVDVNFVWDTEQILTSKFACF